MKRILLSILVGVLVCGCSPAKTGSSAVLKLGHWLKEPEVSEPTHESCDLEVHDLSETPWRKFDETLIPDEVTEKIQRDYPETDFEKWNMMIHFYDDEKTAGVIRLRYDIENLIATDKAVTLGIENGRIIDLWYANMDGCVNEEDLLERVNRFRENTIQEKYELKEGETLLEETTAFTYRFGSDELIYTYNIFVEEPTGVINNEIGCEYVIE